MTIRDTQYSVSSSPLIDRTPSKVSGVSTEENLQVLVVSPVKGIPSSWRAAFKEGSPSSDTASPPTTNLPARQEAMNAQSQTPRCPRDNRVATFTGSMSPPSFAKTGHRSYVLRLANLPWTATHGDIVKLIGEEGRKSLLDEEKQPTSIHILCDR